MERVTWELSVLSKAVAFANLTAAAGPVGLSQPQLSRIVSRLEAEFQIVLLDRTARRKSGWTPMAHQLAGIYSKSSRHLSEQIQRLTARDSDPQSVHMGALDGLTTVAADLCSRIFKKTAVRSIELDLFDLTLLEEIFLKGGLDLVFTSREPSRKKFRNVLRLGFQSLEEVGQAGETRVVSPFEFGQAIHGKRTRHLEERVLISNSLSVRRHWIETYGGLGVIPSPMRKSTLGRGKDTPVYLVGNDTFSPRLWEKIAAWI